MRTSGSAPLSAQSRACALLVVFLAMSSLVSTASALQPARLSGVLRSPDARFGTSEVEAPAPHGCARHETQTECHAQCVWCTAAAVPSSCFGPKEAAKLPPSVFVCDQST